MNDVILILTANEASLTAQKTFLYHHCGFSVDHRRFLIKGCQDLPGFDAVAKGEQVDVNFVQPHVVKLTMDMMESNSNIRGVLLECTELPPYADAIRAATGLPVWDAITGCDFYINAFKDNPRFGINDWQKAWAAQSQELPEDLITETGSKGLIRSTTTQSELGKVVPNKDDIIKVTENLATKQNPILGVLRLDYHYPPALGDVDCPASHGYEILFRMVPGLTFEMAQAGEM